jgi:hypothetical protein
VCRERTNLLGARVESEFVVALGVSCKDGVVNEGRDANRCTCCTSICRIGKGTQKYQQTYHSSSDRPCAPRECPPVLAHRRNHQRMTWNYPLGIWFSSAKLVVHGCRILLVKLWNQLWKFAESQKAAVLRPWCAIFHIVSTTTKQRNTTLISISSNQLNPHEAYPRSTKLCPGKGFFPSTLSTPLSAGCEIPSIYPKLYTINLTACQTAQSRLTAHVPYSPQA